MQSLHAILNWWRTVDDFNRPYIAMDVLFRLSAHTGIHTRYEVLFHEFLSEPLPAVRHVGRVLSVRSIIDFWFVRKGQSRSTEMFLEAVEEPDIELKSFANAALGQVTHIQQDLDKAYETWRHLRETSISDAALI